jgi:hypothetical protein
MNWIEMAIKTLRSRSNTLIPGLQINIDMHWSVRRSIESHSMGGRMNRRLSKYWSKAETDFIRNSALNLTNGDYRKWIEPTGFTFKG